MLLLTVLLRVALTGGVRAQVIDLATLDGTNGFRLDGIDADDLSGLSVSGAGDVNGDGVDDLIIGARGADPGDKDGAGESYVVFGNRSGFAASIDLATLDGSNGFRLDGIDTNKRSGFSVSGAGDVNGDGVDDIIIGAPAAAPGDDRGAGESYVVFGNRSGFAASIDLATLDGINGFRLYGIDSDELVNRFGFSVSGAGDVNGDGFDDLIIGVPNAIPGGDINAGESFVVFGKSSGFGALMDLSTLDGTNGFRLDGIDAGDFSGRSVSGAGDVNGDGFDDIIIGASAADLGDDREGESYVVFGKSSGFAASIDLATLDGSNGFRLDGIDTNDRSGISVSGAGDVNGDGLDDLIIGALFAGPGGNELAGESYVVFGKRSGFAASIDLSTLDGSNGFRLDGIDDRDRSGGSVSGAGDINGDGFDDIIIGAYLADPGGDSNAGESYVVFGAALLSLPTGVAVEPLDALPEVFALAQNYPNPFNPSTTIRFELPQAVSVVLSVYNLLGQEVARLVSGDFAPGRYAINWQATGLASGVYLYQLRAGTYLETKKLLLLK